MADRRQSVEEFWSDPALVASYSTEEQALPYEVDLITRAVTTAESSGPVRQVHVLGVGGGRELNAIRSAAPDADIAAWDISAAMVESCKRTVQIQGLSRVSVGTADLGDVPGAAGDADVAIALGAVLGFSASEAERDSDFASLSSLLRPGGTLAVVVQQRNGRPDWALWLAMRKVLTRLGLADGGTGDRYSRHGQSKVMFHHYCRSELIELCQRAGFERIRIESLRQWARGRGHRIRLKSPNPLLISAVRGHGSADDGASGDSDH